MNKQHPTELMNRAGSLRIAVVGDLIHDRYIDGIVERISPEAPVPILKITGTRENPGGAGNVVENLKGLGCQVSFYYDEKNHIIKTRIMSGTQHILRMDDEDEPKWMRWDDINYGLGYGISRGKFDCVILSDYGKGMISEEVAKTVIEMCEKQSIPVVVDSKKNLEFFGGATIVKCNKKEWDAFQKQTPGTDSVWDFMRNWEIKNMVITNGDRGMQYWGFDGGLELSGNIPGNKVDICDTCGAGDTVTAVLGVMMALDEGIDDACKIANVAASEVCRHPGVYAIKKADLIKFTEPQPTNGHNIQTNNASVHPIRLQSDATADQSSDQANLEGADGGGDAADEEWEAPYDGGDASRPE